MNVLTAAVSSPFQPQSDYDQDSDQMLEEFTFEPPTTETPFHRAFTLRSAQVDRLIDEKIGYIMESARLHALAKVNHEQRAGSLSLIQELEAKIGRLQERIDREMKGLFYSLQKAPAPSPFLDDLPG